MTGEPRIPPLPYPDGSFRRDDEADDGWFYARPRLVVHIDEPAIAAIGEYFATALPTGSTILDLMSSWRTHLPDGFNAGRVIGLGMNSEEMADNPQLDEHFVHDLNVNPALPFPDGEFDACVVTVSVQYLTRPVEVFKDVSRVLKPGAAFHVIYSSRMFFTKAVAMWKALDGSVRGNLVESYFRNSGGWSNPERLDISPRPGAPSDPVYVVTARKVA